jgi:hypothetical protein
MDAAADMSFSLSANKYHARSGRPDLRKMEVVDCGGNINFYSPNWNWYRD